MKSFGTLSALLGTLKQKSDHILSMSGEEVNSLVDSLLKMPAFEKDHEGYTPYFVLTQASAHPEVTTERLEKIYFLNPSNDQEVFPRSYKKYLEKLINNPSVSKQLAVYCLEQIMFKPHFSPLECTFKEEIKVALKTYLLSVLPSFTTAFREASYREVNHILVEYAFALDIPEEEFLDSYNKLLSKRSKNNIITQESKFKKPSPSKPLTAAQFDLFEKLNVLVREQFNSLTRADIEANSTSALMKRHEEEYRNRVRKPVV